MNILVTGGTGLIGKALINKLLNNGHKVSVISRGKNPISGCQVYDWSPEDLKIALESTEVIVHLAGASIGEKRWTEARKKVIVDSRVETLKALEKHANYKVLKKVVSASGVGFYGNSGDKTFNINSPLGTGFLADCCSKWEQALWSFKGVETIALRTGLVLSENAEALKKMALPIKFYVGSALGSGQQWMSWIHLDDLVNLYVESIETLTYSGVVNAVSPESKKNIDFVKSIAKRINRPLLLPAVPAVVLKLILGEMSALILDSVKVKPAEFNFRYPTLELALEKIFK